MRQLLAGIAVGLLSLAASTTTWALGGGRNAGNVYVLTPPPAGQSRLWTYTDLHAVTIAEGAQPIGGLFESPSGTLYGLLAFAGNKIADGNVAYALAPSPGVVHRTLSALHNFTRIQDGTAFDSLAGGSAQNGILALYGTTTSNAALSPAPGFYATAFRSTFAP